MYKYYFREKGCSSYACQRLTQLDLIRLLNQCLIYDQKSISQFLHAKLHINSSLLGFLSGKTLRGQASLGNIIRHYLPLCWFEIQPLHARALMQVDGNQRSNVRNVSVCQSVAILRDSTNTYLFTYQVPKQS